VTDSNELLPKARREDILFEEVGGDLLLYDQKIFRAHCLNRTAALVWKNADGTRSVADLVFLLKQEDGRLDENIVWFALAELRREGLLEGEVSVPVEVQIPRRRLISKLGVAMAAALPLVASIAAPRAVMAASRRPTTGFSCPASYVLSGPPPSFPVRDTFCGTTTATGPLSSATLSETRPRFTFTTA
jgi:hypothetical protein